MKFDIQSKIDSGEIDLKNEAHQKAIIKSIAKRINELGLKKGHVASYVKPSETAVSLSNFLRFNPLYVNSKRIVKYCNYLDEVKTY